MAAPDVTCWTLIRAAQDGAQTEREEFARRYLPVIDAYLRARWSRSRLKQDLDDAAQEVFVEFFRDDGALDRLKSDRPGGFRAFLYGVVRNVALRLESRQARKKTPRLASDKEIEEFRVDEPTLSQAFDRAWAMALLKEAWEVHAERVDQGDDDCKRRWEILRLRFEDGLPIREIASRWGVDAASIHSAYRAARREFKSSLLEVVSFHRPGSPEGAEAECREILQLIGGA